MKRYKNKKGITLIELIITLGLIGIIIALVFSFFFTNKKTLNKVEVKSDLQYEAKVILESVSKYAMSATKVDYVKSGGDLSLITFTLIPDSNNDAKTAEFKISGSNISLSTKKQDGSIINHSDLSSNLKEVIVSESKSESIDIDLTMEYKGIEYEVTESYVFRNGHKE